MAFHVHSDKPVFELVIGDKTFSSWSMRAWLVAVQSGLPFKETLIQLDTPQTEAAIAKHSPSGKVPVLKHGKTVVWDSLAIAEYLNELSPEAQLWPADAALRAQARSFAAEMHSGFASLRGELSMDLRQKTEVHHLSSRAVDDIMRVLELWTLALSKSQGPYLFGDFCIADAFFAPVVFRFKTYGIKIKDKGLQAYMKNIEAHHGVEFWLSEARKEKIEPVVFTVS